jgi:hypothetical protein
MANVIENTAATDLDIFLRDFQGNLTDPTSISFVISDPTPTAVAAGAGTKIDTGHYDARVATIPSGLVISSPWSIAWTFVFSGVSKTATEAFNVLSSAPCDTGTLTDQIKLDLGITTEFTDAQIVIFIEKALTRLNRRLNFTGTVSELSFSSSTGLITPTPSESIHDLILLQTECLIVKTRQATAVNKGIRVRDGDSMIDTTAGFRGHGDVVSSVCDELEEAIKTFLRDVEGAQKHGDLVWYGNSRIIETDDHDGQAHFSKSFQSPFDDHVHHHGHGHCRD